MDGRGDGRRSIDEEAVSQIAVVRALPARARGERREKRGRRRSWLKIKFFPSIPSPPFSAWANQVLKEFIFGFERLAEFSKFTLAVLRTFDYNDDPKCKSDCLYHELNPVHPCLLPKFEEFLPLKWRWHGRRLFCLSQFCPPTRTANGGRTE